jgi:hypothetical protein
MGRMYVVLRGEIRIFESSDVGLQTSVDGSGAVIRGQTIEEQHGMLYAMLISEV